MSTDMEVVTDGAGTGSGGWGSGCGGGAPRAHSMTWSMGNPLPQSLWLLPQEPPCACEAVRSVSGMLKCPLSSASQSAILCSWLERLFSQ